eukprot:m.191312 g.191312  ORF g.191312 m.191312 type:complete len:289 (-) comp18246_c6_seq1:473-1339(-)
MANSPSGQPSKMRLDAPAFQPMAAGNAQLPFPVPGIAQPHGDTLPSQRGPSQSGAASPRGSAAGGAARQKSRRQQQPQQQQQHQQASGNGRPRGGRSGARGRGGRGGRQGRGARGGRGGSGSGSEYTPGSDEGRRSGRQRRGGGGGGGGILGKAVRESAKPGRAGGDRWVLHGTAAWSKATLESSKEAAATALVEAFHAELRQLGTVHDNPIPEPDHCVAHRWRYSQIVAPASCSSSGSSRGDSFGIDHGNRLATCGDWHLGGPDGVEAAWLSGHHLGVSLAATLAKQ